VKSINKSLPFLKIKKKMARPNQEAIETFISITGVAEDVAVQKLEVTLFFNQSDCNLEELE
jgi:hypothetical protein